MSGGMHIIDTCGAFEIGGTCAESGVGGLRSAVVIADFNADVSMASARPALFADSSDR